MVAAWGLSDPSQEILPVWGDRERGVRTWQADLALPSQPRAGSTWCWVTSWDTSCCSRWRCTV